MYILSIKKRQPLTFAGCSIHFPESLIADTLVRTNIVLTHTVGITVVTVIFTFVYIYTYLEQKGILQ